METKPASKNGHHILLVDDEPSLIQITSKFLQRAGYQTTSVRSGMEALQAFERQPGQFQSGDYRLDDAGNERSRPRTDAQRQPPPASCLCRHHQRL